METKHYMHNPGPYMQRQSLVNVTTDNVHHHKTNMKIRDVFQIYAESYKKLK